MLELGPRAINDESHAACTYDTVQYMRVDTYTRGHASTVPDREYVRILEHTNEGGLWPRDSGLLQLPTEHNAPSNKSGENRSRIHDMC